MSDSNIISIKPMIGWPRQVVAGRKYWISVDLRPADEANWPYDEEEYVVFLRLRHSRIFQIEEIGEPSVVLHRFGGSYGPAKFGLTTDVPEGSGELVLEMRSGWGIPIGEIELKPIEVVKRPLIRRPDPSLDLDYGQQSNQLQSAYEQGTIDKDAFQAAMERLRASASQDSRPTLVDRDAVFEGLDGSAGTETNNSIAYITTIYQQAPGAPLLDEAQFDAALERYLAWVERRFGRLNLRGIEKRQQQVLSLTLDDIYVSLAAVVTPRQKGYSRPEQDSREEALEPVDMSHLLSVSPRLVITGGPGCGKTSYLHLIAGSVARAMRLNETEGIVDHLGLAEPLPLPIVISLSEFNRYRRRQYQAQDPQQGTFIRFFNQSLIRQEAAIRLPEDFFERLLVQGRACLLLLDGLDEVANERERVLVARAVENLAHNDGVRQIVVTSRTRAYQGQAVLPEDFRAAAVQPMSTERVQALAERWCSAVYDETEAAQETKRLQEAISGLERLREARHEPRLADTPLMVTIIAIVHYNQRRLPEQRAELYEKCVEVLLAESNKPVTEATFELADWGGTLAEKRGLLGYLAYKMMQAGEEGGRQVSEKQLAAWLRPRLANRYGEIEAEAALTTFIRAMRERESLLDERGGSYQFTQVTFQEFLCATYLAENVRDPQKIVAFLAENGWLAEAWWRETVLLTAGYLGLKSAETALDFLQALTALSAADDVALAAAELAGSAFIELDSQDTTTKDAVVSRLVTLLTDFALDIPPVLRLLAGDALGQLGDPRPGIITLEPALVSIPAGPFQMGDDRYAVVIERPFAIARYAVTNSQYRRFVEDGGYTNRWRACWTEEGWLPMELNKWTGPYYWSNPRLNKPNQPVVGVSWFEAIAYAAWLSMTTGHPYRLPTEAEWERAARHYDGRLYPWGNDWQTGITNAEESGLGRPTAVGIFPKSNTYSGVTDMVGNVWEWCQTRWQNERGRRFEAPYRADDGRESLAGGSDVSRSVRGGSWSDEVSRLRSASRIGNFPDDRDDVYGFRLVVSPYSIQQSDTTKDNGTRFERGHALIFGSGADLPVAIDDAVGLAMLLADKERCAYPLEQVRLLTSSSTTRAGVLDSIRLLAERVDDTSTVVVYFSGHGYEAQTSAGKQYYLLPFGYDINNLPETAISSQELSVELRAIPAQNLLILLDCSHAGGFARELSHKQKLAIIASSHVDQLSYVGASYSAFTQALLEALCGRDVSRKDGYVRVSDLAMYISRRVPELTRDRQHPVLEYTAVDNFRVAYYAGGDDEPRALPVFGESG